MIPSAFENVKRLSDAQLQDLIADARKGDMSAIQALNLTSATPVLAEMMRREKMREMFQQNMSPQMPGPQTVLDKILAKAEPSEGIGSLDIPGALEEDSFAGGGIVSFQSGGTTAQQSDNILYSPKYYGDEVAPSMDRELSAEEVAKLPPRQYAAYRRERAKKGYELERAGLGFMPQEYTDEEQQEIQKKQLDFLRGISEPSTRRMQELLEKQRPDEAKTKEELERTAINRGFASMIGAPRTTRSRLGSFAQNVGAAVRGGMDSYEKGIVKIEQAKKDYAKSEMEFLKAKLADEAGDIKAANVYMANAVKDRQNAVRAYRGGIADIQRRQSSEEDNITREEAALIREETAAQERKRREAQLEAEIKAGKYERRGGGGGPRQMTEGQYLASIAREEKAIRENRTRMSELKKIYGSGEALDDAIYRLAIDKVNRSTSERAGKPATKPGEKPKPGENPKAATQLPEGAVVIPL